MDDSTAENPEKPASQRIGFNETDRADLRKIGSNLRRILQGEDLLDISQRRDELGIITNLVIRVAKEVRNSRRRDEDQRRKLQLQFDELRKAQEQEERLMYTIRELSTPILNIHRGILLLPIIGAMDSNRASAMINTLLQRIEGTRAQVVILDITGMPVVDTQVANVILQAAQAAQLLGSKVLLCGMTPDVAQVIVNLGINLDTLTPSSDLDAALEQAFTLIGLKVVSRHLR